MPWWLKAWLLCAPDRRMAHKCARRCRCAVPPGPDAGYRPAARQPACRAPPAGIGGAVAGHFLGQQMQVIGQCVVIEVTDFVGQLTVCAWVAGDGVRVFHGGASGSGQ